MPKVLNYSSNSIIYFQGDIISDRIFILHQGKVSLNYKDIETGKEIREVIKPGEFFGVKSALGHYPREENAVTISDSKVMIFTILEFESFAKKNSQIIIKMLKVFSNQLRRVHRQVDVLLSKDEVFNPELGLLNTGEFYLINKRYSNALYVFNRYLTYYPTGAYAEKANNYCELSESLLHTYGDNRGKPPSLVKTAPTSTRQVQPNLTVPSHAKNLDISWLDITSNTKSQPVVASSTNSGAAGEYFSALSLYGSEQYKEALDGFKRIIENDSDIVYVKKSLFDLGRCLYMLGQYDLTIKHFTQLLQTYPKHDNYTEVLYYLGQSFEKKGEIAKSLGFYNKIIASDEASDSVIRIDSAKAIGRLKGQKL